MNNENYCAPRPIRIFFKFLTIFCSLGFIFFFIVTINDFELSSIPAFGFTAYGIWIIGHIGFKGDYPKPFNN